MSTEGIFPVPNSTTSFWHSEEDEFRNFRSSEDLPTEVDVVIVGSGLSGASLAYYLSKSDSPPKTLMLEARYICSGATGRNGGHCRPDYYLAYDGFEQKYGAEEAALIGNFEYINLNEVKKTVEENNIDCDFVLTRVFDCHITDNYKKFKETLLRSLKNPHNIMPNDTHYCEGDAAVTLSHVKDAKFVVSYTGASLWPYKFTKGLLKIALAKGDFFNLQANTPATEIETLEDGSYIVHTPRGPVKTKKVVMATNGYTAGLSDKFKDLLVPVKATCSHIKPTKGRAPHLTNSILILKSKADHEYLINRPDGTIVVGGAINYYFPKVDNWYGKTDDSTLFKDTARGSVMKHYSSFMGDTFYSWEGIDTEVDHLWTGIQGYTADMLPFVGQVPGEPNKYVTAGFCGHGMPRVMLCAKAISDCILDGKTIEETDIPKSFMLTKERFENTPNDIMNYMEVDLYSQEDIDLLSQEA
ncbi:hypothetical protein CANARDRAFT_8824 [[Candida] arabinofermentans NRRL YB-2248]|uniref:FAD dependent oxidoreductase domain-containing protein n=1 Tax=[Candida] arabinofermentans NRRL YB-2248 TaxID=983967 RepID=A0A1E4SXC6_9ASCO|nr:hypothetical protein CANARDRAFT_8824 [[Candida] arabinofermentans NRRL YB-2248]